MEEVEEKQPPTVLTSDTENHTKISPEDAPPGQREKYRKFRAYNTGMWNGPRRENKEAMFRQDNLHRYDAISSKLGLTNYQQSRGRSLFDDLTPSIVQEDGLKIDEAIFLVCIKVANQDVQSPHHDSRGARYWPDPSGTNSVNDTEFEEMGESLGISVRRQQALVQKIDL